MDSQDKSWGKWSSANEDTRKHKKQSKDTEHEKRKK